MQFLRKMFIVLKVKKIIIKPITRKKKKSILGTYSFTMKNTRKKIDYEMLVGKC